MSIKYFLVVIGVISLLVAGCSNNQNAIFSSQAEDQKDQEISEVNELESAEVKNLLSLQGQLSEIVANGDVNRCQELKLDQFVVSCEVNILSAQAKSSDDITVCDKSSTEYIKTRCVAAVQLRQ